MGTPTVSISGHTAVFTFSFLCVAGWFSAARVCHLSVTIHYYTCKIFLYVVVLLQDESLSITLSFAFTGREVRLSPVYAMILSVLLHFWARRGNFPVYIDLCSYS